MHSSWRNCALSRVIDHADRFVRTVQRYARCCQRIEKEYSRNRLRTTDIELVYCSSFLSVCARWETFLEEVLFEAACGLGSSRAGNWRHAAFRSRESMRNILTHGGKSYLTLGTFENAASVTAVLVNEGRPISAVSTANRTLIGEAVQIRNAIAHDSLNAKVNFRNKVPGVGALPNSKRTPGAFLRHEFRVEPNQRRYQLYFAAYRTASMEIGSAW